MAPEKYIGFFVGCMMGILLYILLNIVGYISPYSISIGGISGMSQNPIQFLWLCVLYGYTLYCYWVVVFHSNPGIVDTRNENFSKVNTGTIVYKVYKV